jgi:hypothetical protein
MVARALCVVRGKPWGHSWNMADRIQRVVLSIALQWLACSASLAGLDLYAICIDLDHQWLALDG